MFPRRPLAYLLGACALALFCAALWLPVDLGPRGEAAGKPKNLATDLALVPGDCVGFVCLKPGDIIDDPFYSGVFGMLTEGTLDEQNILVGSDQVDRLTFVVTSKGFAEIIRTKKAYDVKELKKKVPVDRYFRPVPKEKEGKKEDKQSKEDELNEKKVGGKTIYYRGRYVGFIRGVCLVDKHTFAIGTMTALEEMLASRAKMTDEMGAALALGGKHTLVAAANPKLVRRILSMELSGPGGARGGDYKEKGKKETPIPSDKKDKECGRLPDKEDKEDRQEEKESDAFPFLGLPFKPLLLGKSIVVVADLKPSPKGTATFAFQNKEQLEDGEVALKSLAYTAREGLGMAVKMEAPDLLTLVKPIQTALKGMKVEKKGNTLSGTVSMSFDADARKKVATVMLERIRRTRAMNTLKQFGIAFHNYHDTYGHFPAAIVDKNGKPLLSWRVAMLPYIEQDNLYKQFKLDEPWDSAHNKKLIAKMPKLYAPGSIKFKAGTTHYQVVTGPDTMWPKLNDKPRLTTITDGSSNTFLVVEAAEAVEWTKPVDVVIAPKKALPKFGAQFKDIFLALFCDGSVRAMKRNTAETTLRAYISPMGGEVIPAD